MPALPDAIDLVVGQALTDRSLVPESGLGIARDQSPGPRSSNITPA